MDKPLIIAACFVFVFFAFEAQSLGFFQLDETKSITYPIQMQKNCSSLDGDEDGIADGECVFFMTGYVPGKYSFWNGPPYCPDPLYSKCLVNMGNCYSRCTENYFCQCFWEDMSRFYGEQANVESACEEAYGSCCLAPSQCWATPRCGQNLEGYCQNICFFPEHQIPSNGLCEQEMVCCSII